MKQDDEASPCIILDGRALLVKMRITLEPGYAFGSNFEYFYLFLFCCFFPGFFFNFFYFYLFIFFIFLLYF